MLNRGTTVQVTLSNFQVNNSTNIINYFLDGKPIEAKQLGGPIDLKTGDHSLRTVFADGREETRSFLIEKEDDRKPVDVVKRSEASPAGGTGQGAYAGRRAVKLMPPEISLPPMRKLLVVESGQSGPKENEDYSAAQINARTPGLWLGSVGILSGDERIPFAAETSQYGEEIRLPSAGNYDLWWQPMEGKALCIVRNFSIKNRGIVELHPESYLGFVRVLGKKSRSPKWVVLTPVDYGNPIQVAKKYEVDMIVPAGSYDLWIKWIKPAQGPVPEKYESQKLESGLVVKPGMTLPVE
jgi:hypothetical protein